MFDEEFLLSFSRLCRLDYLEGRVFSFVCLFVFMCVSWPEQDQIELHIMILPIYHYSVFYAHMMCYKLFTELLTRYNSWTGNTCCSSLGV